MRLFLLVLMFALYAQAKQLVVAVVDTGISERLVNKPFLCKGGHRDFTGTGIYDNHSHGSHIVGLIEKYAGDSDYCILVLKYFDPMSSVDTSDTLLEALNYAIKKKVDIIEYAGGGKSYSKQECRVIKKALDLGITIVAAAGNEGENINKHPFYPAKCDSRVISVGNLDDKGVRHPTSNYGNSVKVWERGVLQMSYMKDGYYGLLTGTSQASAIVAGKLVKNMSKRQITSSIKVK